MSTLLLVLAAAFVHSKLAFVRSRVLVKWGRGILFVGVWLREFFVNRERSETHALLIVAVACGVEYFEWLDSPATLNKGDMLRACSGDYLVLQRELVGAGDEPCRF